MKSPPPDRRSLEEALALLEALDEKARYKQGLLFKPYPKQLDFMRQGATKRERLLVAGNQVGKTEWGAFETSCHLTGEYPQWWRGRRWERPTSGWIAGETGVLVRDTIQRKLCGYPGVPELLGTGMIPRSAFVGTPSLSRGVTDAFDTIHIRHRTGGISVAQFKSYEQGRKKFQGDTKDWVWLDEEPPQDIYTECLARITATGGMIYCTFTPLSGRTDMVIRFFDKSDKDRGYIQMSLYDAAHMTKDMIDAAVAGYPDHEKDARIFGIPIMGSGRVFSYDERLIKEAPLDYIPASWFKLWGCDFGVGHPFAASLLLHDRDNDVIHVHATVRVHTKPGEPGGMPINHAHAMKQIGAAVPVAWPHDGNKRESDGVTIAAQYRKAGLLMLPSHATHIDGGYGTEAGILQMAQRMENGQFKVSASLGDWWQEFRNYHRDNGLIVKIADDLMSATRIGTMQIRSARQVQLGHRIGRPERLNDGLAPGLDFPLN